VSVDFQRLERLRARRRSRRRRLRGLTALAAGLVLLAAGAVLVRTPAPWILRASEYEASAVSRVGHGGHGEAQGRVQTVEPETGVIRLSSGFLGLMSVAIVLTPDTVIVVGDKEGGFGDIRQGERVLAAYEVRSGVLEATRVEVFPPVREQN
jgi:hypothetical protein